MTTRLRHRPQLEDEDASALKLGAGMLSSVFRNGGSQPTWQSSTMLVAYWYPRSSICWKIGTRMHQTLRMTSSSSHRPIPYLLPVYIIRPSNMWRHSRNSIPPIPPVRCESQFQLLLIPSTRRDWLHLRTLRREPALTQFETAQIANLCPVDAEEAKSVIPR